MESDKMNCIFCNIINVGIPSYTIYEDEIVKVFLDVHPDTNGHMLIVPKRHILDITEIEDSTWNHILKITNKMKSLLEEKLNIDGLTLIQNNGLVQEVKHFHLHLKPYYKERQEILPVEDVYNKLKEK